MIYTCHKLNVCYSPHSSGPWITDPSTGKQYIVVQPEGGFSKRSIEIQQSEETCEYYNAILPEPRTEAENKFVAGLNDMFYLGVNDRDHDGVWTYNSDNSPVTWLTSKPESPYILNVFESKSRGCCLMWNSNTFNLKPENCLDAPCVITRFISNDNVVCQSGMHNYVYVD